VRNENDVLRLVYRTVERFGRLDVAVNSGGTQGKPGRVVEQTAVSYAATFDIEAHTHHKPGSAGALCANCHMPTHTYMVVDVRRDHAIRVPRPDLSIALSTPNACNNCHADRSAQWAAD
jgi:hypothetical protein